MIIVVVVVVVVVAAIVGALEPLAGAACGPLAGPPHSTLTKL